MYQVNLDYLMNEASFCNTPILVSFRNHTGQEVCNGKGNLKPRHKAVNIFLYLYVLCSIKYGMDFLLIIYRIYQLDKAKKSLVRLYLWFHSDVHCYMLTNSYFWLGRIKSPFNCIGHHLYNITNAASKQVVIKIRGGPFENFCCCFDCDSDCLGNKDYELFYLQPDNKKRYALVCTIRGERAGRMFADKFRWNITFPEGLDAGMKAVTLGALLLIVSLI